MNLIDRIEKEKGKIKGGKTDKLFNTETMLPISEIKGNTVVLKDGGLRGIIKVYGLNLDLRNYEEQQVTIEQYKRFLNGLDFPIQILARSTYLDLTDYIQFMKEKIVKIDNDVLRWQGEKYVGFLDDINIQQGLIYTKEFYIIVPYYSLKDNENIDKPWWQKFLNALDTSETPEKIVSRYREFLKNRGSLDTRCNLIIEGLSSIGIASERLGVTDIISLFFKIYNPNAHKAQSESVH